MNLEDMLLSEISQTQRDKLGFHLHKGGTLTETEGPCGCQELEVQGGNGELSLNRYRASPGEDEKVLEVDGGDGCTTR